MSTDTPSSGTVAASNEFDPSGKICVVTGATGGIGSALVRALVQAGAKVVVLTDLDESHTTAVASFLTTEHRAARAEQDLDTQSVSEIVGARLDVSDGPATAEIVSWVEDRYGPVDLWCANAGIGTMGGAMTDPALWQRTWDVNVMAHVHATQALLPGWLDRGRGHLMVTASAAGLLTNLGDAPYSATKHAAVAFAEWLSITHGAAGIGVTCVCPQGVRTPMVFGAEADEFAHLRDPANAGAADSGFASHERDEALALQVVRDKGIVEPTDVARSAIDALRSGRFLALAHPEVAGFEQRRAADHDRWIAGMRKLQAQLDRTPEPPTSPGS